MYWKRQRTKAILDGAICAGLDGMASSKQLQAIRSAVTDLISRAHNCLNVMLLSAFKEALKKFQPRKDKIAAD